MTWNDGKKVEEHLLLDVMDTVKPWIVQLLNFKQYKVALLPPLGNGTANQGSAMLCYRNRSGIVIPKCLVSVSESNFAHPWVSVSVSVSNLSFFGYPTKKNGRFLQFLPYTSSKVLVSVSKSESNFAHPWVSKSVSKSSRPLFGINIVIDTENLGIAGSCHRDLYFMEIRKVYIFTESNNFL